MIGVSGVSALLTGAGATVSITALQLLVYTVLGAGPLGALRPWWWPPVLLLAGVAWAILLLIPGWLVSPLAAERRSTAARLRRHRRPASGGRHAAFAGARGPRRRAQRGLG